MARTIPCAPSHHRRYIIMAASEHTPHYSLSQFGPGDRPSWIDDYNSDMQTLDTAVSDAQSDATEARQSATTNGQSIREINSSLETVNNDLSKIKGDIASIGTAGNNIDVQHYSSINTNRETLSFPAGSYDDNIIKLPNNCTIIGEQFSEVNNYGALVFNKKGVYLVDCSINFFDTSNSNGEILAIYSNINPNPYGENGQYKFNYAYTYFKTGSAISVKLCPMVLAVDTVPTSILLYIGPLSKPSSNNIAMEYSEIQCAAIRLSNID